MSCPLTDYPWLALSIEQRLPQRISCVRDEILPLALREVLGDDCHAVTIPLSHRDVVAALLVVCRAGEGRFSDGDIATLGLLGRIAAITHHNATLHAEVRELAATRTAFLNTVAHDLRAPITVIRGYLSMLEEGTFGAPPSAWEHPLRMVVAKAHELGDLVEELLASASLEAGGTQPVCEVIDLRVTVSAALERAGGRAELVGAHLQSRLGEEPVLVIADPTQLVSILDNLVNNALAYSDGRPWVSVELDASTDEAEIAVLDRGVGIQREQQGRIFERFERLNDPSLPPRPGTGLGLPIARELAERNGGSLVLDSSEPGRGSRFVVRVPLAPEPTAP